ncbi:MAG TPA: PqqD family protein [Solirubrobacteraceae bacterium]|nr:PqqD family protein [Solirubrobacteraceae bacterium]
MKASQSTDATAAPSSGSGAARATSKVVVPHHVVYRSFASETILLNLQTGKYHGLNPTAGAMLAELERASSVAHAARALAGQYERPLDEVEQDVRALCDALLDRGLIEIDGSVSG